MSTTKSGFINNFDPTMANLQGLLTELMTQLFLDIRFQILLQ